MITSRYTVVQYLPRPLTGERINIGVIAWGGGKLAARFVENWRRVRAFGHEDTEFLQDFVRQVNKSVDAASLLPGLSDQTVDEDCLSTIIGSWSHSIQFSEPRASINRIPEAVVNEIASIYLPDVVQPAARARDRASLRPWRQGKYLRS